MTVVSDQLVGVKESVTDELLLLNPYQTPMLNLLGFGEPVSQVEHQWFEDVMRPTQTTVKTQLAAAATTLAVADGSVFAANEVVKVDEELLKITAVDGNNLTVTRAYAGTTDAAHEVGAVVEFQFVEGVEGADARKARYKARTRKSNLTQIFDATISISETAAATSEYGIDDLYEYEKQKKELELALQLEKAIINGVKYESADGLVRQMGGIRQFIQTNVHDASKGKLTLDMLADAFQDIFEAGGFEQGGDYKIIVGAKQKRALSAADADKVNISRQENTRGQVVDFFLSDFGSAEIVLNNNLAPDEVLIIDLNRVEIKPLQSREFSHKYLGSKGDYIEGQIVGEYTLLFEQEQAHARIKGLA